MKQISVIFLSVLMFWIKGSSQTIRTVSNLNDSGTGSLRQMVSISSPGDIIQFGSNLMGDTIILTSGQINVNHNLTIQGLGANLITISGNNSSRILSITGGNVLVRDIKFINGYQNVQLNNDGGAILYSANNGYLRLANVHILNSVAMNGNGSQGGGVAFYSSGGTFRADSCLIKNCESDNFGGAVVINAQPDVAYFNYCIIDSNRTGAVGNLCSNSRKMYVTNSTFVNNTSSGGNALISWDSYGSTDTAFFINSTFSNNIASLPNASLEVTSAVYFLLNCTFSGNNEPILFQGFMSSPTLIVKNNIFNNPNGNFVNNYFLPPNIFSGGGNVSSDITFSPFLTHSTDIHGVNPQLDVLASNGALTPTHALLNGSPAIGNAVNSGAPAHDQRGIPRTLPYDAGAFETNIITPTVSISSNAPVCVGQTLALSASQTSGATYAWTGPNGFTANSRIVSLTNATNSMSGVYTVVMTVNSVSVQDTYTVIITTQQNVSIVSNSPVCTGGTLQLSVVGSTGQYLWTGPNGFTANGINPSIPNVGSNNVGIYTVSMIQGGCGQPQSTTSVTISSGITAIGNSNSPVCEGSVVYLNSPSIAGATYSWQGPNGFSSSVQNASLSNASPSLSGNYTLTVVTPNCGTSTTNVPVTVGGTLNNSNALNNGPLCSGAQLNLSVNTVANGTYSWSGPGGFTSNLQVANRQNTQINQGGIYTVVINSPGCGSTTRTTSVAVNSSTGLNAGSNSPLCQGDAIYLSCSNLSGGTYSWTGPNNFSSNVQFPSVSYAQSIHSGVYTLISSVPGCGAFSNVVSVVVNSPVTSLIVTNNSPVCSGNTLQLSITSQTGYQFNWSGPSGFVSTLGSPAITNSAIGNSGVYTVTVISPGCGSTTRTISARVSNTPVVSVGSNSPVCQNGVIFLTSSSHTGASYSWSGPNGFVSTTQNPSISNCQPTASGVYTLMVTSSGCGVISSTTAVSIGSNPATLVATSNSPVCSGLNLNLSATVLSNLTYVWSGPGGFTSNQAQPILAGVNSGNAGVYTLQASSAGCTSVTRLHTVVVSNLAITPGSNSPICQGAALMLTTNALSGASYSWSGPNGFVSTIQNSFISNAQAVHTGIYTLTVSSGSCGTASATTSVVVGSNINSLSLTSNSPVCTGNNLNLSITNRTGFTFNWAGPNGFTSNVATPVINAVTGSAAGRYTVVVVSAGCGTTTVQSSNISVNNVGNVFASSTSPVCLGEPIYFSGIAPAGSTYSWSGPSGFVSTTRNPSRHNAQLSHAGVYTMTANVIGCGAITTTTTVVVNPCRSAEDNTSDLDAFLDNENWTVEVYPNPTESKTKVRITGWKGELPTLRVLDLLGHEILMRGGQETIQGELSWILDFGGISKGIYFISIQTEQGKRVERLVVQ
jgi:hypothetical protein